MLHSCSRYSRTNFSFSSITLLVFHGMRSVLLAPAITLQCQVSSRSILSGICPVCTFTPPRHFFIFVANTALHPNRPLGLPCVTLGWPLRGPCVALGPP